MENLRYIYIWKGERHENCETEYLKGLGMDEPTIEYLQRNAREAQTQQGRENANQYPNNER